MRSLRIAAATILPLLLIAQAQANWAAIAYDSYTGASGSAAGLASKIQAEHTALRNCGDGCSILAETGSRECLALATTPDHSYGVAFSREWFSAVKRAMSECAPYGHCTWQVWACNSY